MSELKPLQSICVMVSAVGSTHMTPADSYVKLDDAISIINTQAEKIAELQADAERYRWLRRQPDNTDASSIDVVQWETFDESSTIGKSLRFEKLDFAIDEAMKG